MNNYELLDKLRSSELGVFSAKDVARQANININSAYVKINRMVKIGKIFKIEAGKFSLSEDPFVISSQVIKPSYISFISAMYLHGKIEQVINEIFIISPKKKKKMMIMNTPVNFITMKPELIFGYTKVKKESSYIFLAELEKALIDCLYLPRYTTIGTVLDVIKEGLDTEVFQKYALKMNTEAVIRRAGYLLDQAGFETDLRPRTKTVYQLNPSLDSGKVLNRKWRLYINELV